jgi:hypothetical protein
MAAVHHQPVDYVIQQHTQKHNPFHVVAKGTSDYHEFMVDKVLAKNERIEFLEEQLEDKKIEIISYRVGVIGLAITLGLTLYNWLVVCGGSAPI